MKIKHNAFIAIGSNLNNPISQVKSAIKALNLVPKSHINKISSLYQTQPHGDDTDQPDFVNAVVSYETCLNAHELLTELERIEMDHGRTRSTRRWGPRTLDLDIILFDRLAINTPRLIVPHPEFHKRTFVLLPLQEIVPDLIMPSGKSIQEQIETLPKTKFSIISDSI